MTGDFSTPPPPGRGGPETYRSLIARSVTPATQAGQYIGPGRSGVLISIHPDIGPGYLELSSPDAYCEYSLQESSDLIAFDRRLRTGPASYSGVYLPSGGIVRFELKGQPLQGHIVNDDNGLVDFTIRPNPRVAARFYVGLEARPKTEPARFINIEASPLSDRPPIGAGVPVGIAFPPHYCRYFSVSTDQPLQVETATEAGTIRQSVVTAIPPVGFPCSPWEFIHLHMCFNQVERIV